MDALTLQWIILVGFGLLFFFLAPLAKTPSAFFQAVSKQDKKPGFLLLTASLVISWIFAKSITVAADLGLAYGFVGGLAYATYYLSFLVAGIVIYRLRVKGGYKSIHDFLQSRFGRGAVILFSLLIGIRLFNEIWSNTMVIGSYFGESGSAGYFTAALVFTGLTLAYTMKGGLRSSLLTDAIQMIFFGLLLFILLGYVFGSGNEGVVDFVNSGDWEMSAGLNLLFAALIQVFSYPFHDSVLTDRGFISDPKTTLKSYLAATVIGFFCILAFSMVGVYARFAGMEGHAAVEVSKILGVVGMLAMNFIMITSAASTLDSAFSSFSKLMVIDLARDKVPTVSRGRMMMVVLTVIGSIPLFLGAEILSATTISGTMVMGLAPVFLFWNARSNPWSFYLPVGFGIFVGILLATKSIPDGLVFFEGKYGDLLSANLWGIGICFILYAITIPFSNGKFRKQS